MGQLKMARERIAELEAEVAKLKAEVLTLKSKPKKKAAAKKSLFKKSDPEVTD